MKKKMLGKQKKIIATLKLAGRTNESLIEEYGVTEKEINRYAEKYRDDDTFEVSKSITQPEDWEKAKKRQDLDEQFIMENHEKLYSNTKEKLETNADYIKRQSHLPRIRVNSKDIEEFGCKLVPLEEIEWNRVKAISTNILECYPDKEAFEKGILQYYCKKHIYVKEKVLRKYGFKLQIVDSLSVFTVTNLKKIYKPMSLKVITPSKKTLNQILKNNNLDTKDKRSPEFSQWLIDQGY